MLNPEIKVEANRTAYCLLPGEGWFVLCNSQVDLSWTEQGVNFLHKMPFIMSQHNAKQNHCGTLKAGISNVDFLDPCSIREEKSWITHLLLSVYLRASIFSLQPMWDHVLAESKIKLYHFFVEATTCF